MRMEVPALSGITVSGPGICAGVRAQVALCRSVGADCSVHVCGRKLLRGGVCAGICAGICAGVRTQVALCGFMGADCSVQVCWRRLLCAGICAGRREQAVQAGWNSGRPMFLGGAWCLSRHVGQGSEPLRLEPPVPGGPVGPGGRGQSASAPTLTVLGMCAASR